MKQFVHVGTGRNRIVYRRGNIVIKMIPLNDDGVNDNWYEANTFRSYGKRGFIPYAACRLWRDNILVMEYIEHTGRCFIGCPAWADYVDCGQIGRDKAGRLVAYDYGVY